MKFQFSANHNRGGAVGFHIASYIAVYWYRGFSPTVHYHWIVKKEHL